MRAPSTRSLVLINDMELLHAGLGVLMAHYLACDDAVRPCLAFRISRQLRIIAEHRDLPDRALRPLYRTMAARWQVRAIHGVPYATQPSDPHPSLEDTLWEEAV
ncbi:MAG: hypothetical protein ACREXU_17350 [Gammaproteobacteria bacterium]